MKTLDITDMSNRQIEDLIHKAMIELQDREYRIYEDAITNHIYVGEVDEKKRQGYIDYLRHVAHLHPAAEDILTEWYSEIDRKQSMNTTGA